LLTRHLEGILNYCHEPVPFGTVEAINGNIRAMLRRGRGYRGHEYLLLKVQRATATRAARAPFVRGCGRLVPRLPERARGCC
jgi:hypothetical protein